MVAQLRSGLERDLVSALTIGPHPPSPSLRAPSPSPALGSNQARASYLAHTEKRAAQAAAAAASRQSKAQAIALQKLKADLLVCYNAAIKACGKAGALREALDLYEVRVCFPLLERPEKENGRVLLQMIIPRASISSHSFIGICLLFIV